MNNIKKYLIPFVFILTAALASADSGGGTVALPFLKMDMGARYYGMAGAATAFADDVTGMTFYNPAALGRIDAFQISATTYHNTLDLRHNYGGLAFPVNFLSLSGNSPLKVGLSVYMFDKGDIEEMGVKRSIGDDISFNITLAENIATHTWDFINQSSEVRHFIGATGKYIRSTLPKETSGEVTADVFAFDAGYTVTVDNRFGFGLALKNLGGKVKYVEEEDPLPTTLSAGLFAALIDVESVRWDISTDYIRHIKEKEDRLRIGTEVVFFNLLAARGGVKLAEEIKEEYSIGFGLKLFGFEVDFGTILNPQLNSDNVYQASISYKFPVSKKDDSYDKDAKKRDEYKQSSAQQTKQAQETAERNTNPILYQ